MMVVLALVAAAAAYFGRGFLSGLFGKGCEDGGCANCGSGGCTLSKLEALKKEYEAKKGRA
jgi:hypothetical protein